ASRRASAHEARHNTAILAAAGAVEEAFAFDIGRVEGVDPITAQQFFKRPDTPLRQIDVVGLIGLFLDASTSDEMRRGAGGRLELGDPLREGGVRLEAVARHSPIVSGYTLIA